MRPLTLTLLCCTAVILTACNKKAADNGAAEKLEANAARAGPDYYTIHAMAVVSSSIGALAGQFQIAKTGAPNGIPSDRLGGACLVFSAADLGLKEMAAKTCNTNTDCQTRENYAAPYCDGQTHTCWALPAWDPNGDLLCNKGKVFPAEAINPVPAQPIDVTKYGIKAGAKVRVDACLNKAGFSPPPPCKPVESPDRIQDMGPVATVK